MTTDTETRFPPAGRRRGTAISILKAVAAVIAALVCLIGVQAVGFRVLSAVPDLLAALILAAVGLGVYAGVVRVTEARWPAELTLRRALPDTALGLVIGAGLFTVIVGVIWVFGYYRVDGTNPLGVVWTPLAAALLAGTFEELIFRGVIFRRLEQGLGTWLALAVSAALFGLLHAGNPNATLFSTVAIALQAGVLLGAAYVTTRRLWLPIGLHIAWNFTQSGVFGVRVSGNEADGILESSLSGPTLVSGGAFGVEGSVITVVIGLVLAALLMAWAHRHHQIRTPAWRRSAHAE